MTHSVPTRPSKHGVVAVLQDGAGRHLYIKRALTLVRAPGVWCFPGGEVEAGESFEAAIEREVLEEVGLVVRAEAKIHESVSPNGEFLLHWMRVQLSGSEAQICPNPKEVAATRWLLPNEAMALDPILPTLRTWLEPLSKG
ncbi:MAG: NUDIX hydrolase [Planctomycetes bacterium]|nr:NUDIX hydrolase [Planctomycetota bacterium]